MDVLASCPARVPLGGEKVFKDDCVFCYHSPESDGGLYVCVQTFLGFCQDHVGLHNQKTGHCVFLHFKRIKKLVDVVEEQGPAKKKPTRLAIGLEGGFDSEQGKVEYEEFNSVAVLQPGSEPALFPLPCPELPMQIQNSVAGILSASSASFQEQALAWDGDKRKPTKHADTLKQLDNGVKIPPKGWICSKCDKTDNLWMNLTDGTILCGRKYFDGTGGNNHAVEYYEQTGFPLAVKLGTITLDGADVYSYDEDDMVENPNLARHLEHFGINIAEMKKTDRTMTELEIDLNMKVREWDVIQEAGKKLTPLYGAGYTGLINLGNSCYLNSVMQVLFAIPEFKQRYVDLTNQIFQKAPPDPSEDFDVQMSKLGEGLLSGRYSLEPEKMNSEETEQQSQDQTGISPHMFKSMIGRGHAEFSTNRQQDAQEFFMHLLTNIDRNERTNQGPVNPVDCFRFEVEERIECTSSGKVRYKTREETTWSLPIPLEAAINQEEMATYEAKKKQMDELKQTIEPSDIVRPRISLSSCIEAFSSPEMVADFYSSAIKAKTTAKKLTRFSKFPEYLMIQMKKFTVGEDWVPKKLDVSLEIPDELDIGELRGTGKQPGEEELPDDSAPAAAVPAIEIDEEVVSQLVDMGFPLEACKKAVYHTKNTGSEMAMNWILEHIGDADFSSPLVIPGASAVSSEPDVNEEAVALITSMGFTRRQAILALRSTDNNLERAADWIFSHAHELNPLEDVVIEPAGPTFKDGPGKYKLVAFISHMGTSTSCGHYVCHIMKDGRWVIFNDRKVAISETPPKELAYLYLYKRI